MLQALLGMGGPMAGAKLGAAGGAGAAGPSFWTRFSQMFGRGGVPGMAPGMGSGGGGPASSNPFTSKLGSGAELVTAYLDNLENRIGRSSEMFRGPTTPFLPHLNTGGAGPNINPGQEQLAALLRAIASRRG